MSIMKQQKGYLFVDHRASPGIPEDKARRMGYDPKFVCEGKLYEADMLHCAHCNAPKRLTPGRPEELEYCILCNADYICDPCAVEKLKPDYVHTPFKKIVDLVKAGEVTVQSLGVRPVLIPTKGKEI